MRDFEYEAPVTVADAVDLLQRHGGTARPLAGGTDLIDYIRTGRVSADVVVDIKRIPNLNVLEVGPDGLRLGAAVPCRRIIQHPAVRETYSALEDSCSILGGMQIQSRASVGGNLCTSGAAADTTPALIALSATCHIAGPDGTRSVPVEEFCTGVNQNVLGPGELLVDLTIPAPQPGTGSHYRRFIPRNEMDIAVVGVGASVTLNEQGSITAARIGLGAVGPRAILATSVAEFLVGKTPDDDVFKQAGDIAKTLISPIDDHRGTIEFRTHVTGVLVERVLRTACERAAASLRK